jgi:uncharacterized protein YjbI with pentapeptide repeats
MPRPARVNFDNDVLKGVNLSSNNIGFAQAFEGKDEYGKLTNDEFQSSNLAGAIFTGDDLDADWFVNDDLTGAVFNSDNLYGAVNAASNIVFTDDQMNHVKFIDANLTYTDFTGAKTSAVFASDTLRGADFSGMTIEKPSFYIGGLNNNETLPSTNFVSDDAESSIFSGAHLGTAIFSKTTLSNCNFVGANLVHAQFDGDTVSLTRFAGANFNSVISRQLVGKPASLPSGWVVRYGTFVAS